MTDRPQIPALDRCITTVWRRAQTLRMAQGVFVFAVWAVALFLAGFLVDWAFSTPPAVRTVIVLAVIAVPLYQAWCAGWRHLRPFDATRTALQIEDHGGGMDSLLVSAVQFRDATVAQGGDDSLTALTFQLAEQRAGALNAHDVVRYLPLRRPALAVLAVLVVLSGFAVVLGSTLGTGAARLFAPWLAIEYPTRTQVQLVQGDMVVQEGKPVRLAARIGGVMPRQAEIELRTGKGQPRAQEMPIVDAACEYQIETVFREFDYRIIAGDARSDWHTVRVVFPPNIQRAQVQLDYPAYTQRSPETVQTLTLTVPETTRVRWTLSLDRAVQRASLNLAGQNPVPIDISPDGLTASFEQVAADSRAYTLTWVEREHGFEFTSPSFYLQVAPDRAPRIELTSPRRDIYATLGRKIDLAYRGRDDHGMAKAFVVYSVDKIEEQKVAFTPIESIDGGEQTIDWDYRSALPDLAEGQAVSFAVEVVDRYPGLAGPHRVRSDLRRVQFVSREEYLAYVEQQKARLLSQLRTIYREQRQVFELVLQFDPSSAVFIQNCQLEAVRQDLMRDRLNKLAARLKELADDLDANAMDEPALTIALNELHDDVLGIGSEHLAAAAQSLRHLAGQGGEQSADGAIAVADASDRVDSAARELGLLVLELGYQDASDVMARELHAAAQNQAALRLQTLMSPDRAESTAQAQERLGTWLTRLFEASPDEKESTVDQALVAFTLTRLVKQMLADGVDTKMVEAAALIRTGSSTEQAARVQEQVIAALLKAEFRLRVGAEREALAKAMVLLQTQIDRQRALRTELDSLDQQIFSTRHSELALAQDELQKHLLLLLMPQIPARRPSLLDDVLPAPPPLGAMLAEVDRATVASSAALKSADRQAVLSEQAKAEAAYESLVQIIEQRIARLTEAVRIERMAYGSQEIDEKLKLFSERQVGLLEKIEDAAAGATPSNYLASQQQALADAVEELRLQIERATDNSSSSNSSKALITRIEQAVALMRQAEPLIVNKQPAAATALLESAESALSASRQLLAEHTDQVSTYAAMLAMTEAAIAPSPYILEIEQEQKDLLALTQKTKLDDLPTLGLAQKNLIHAVDAILVALDPVSHLVETDTVMLFAKEDMNAAAVGLEKKDSVEVDDAQRFIVETLQELRSKTEAVIPQYTYLLEIVEALHEAVGEGVLIREAQRELGARLTAAPDGAALLAPEQQALAMRAQAHGQLMHEIAGFDFMQTAAASMAEAKEALEQADSSRAMTQIARAQQACDQHNAQTLKLMKHLGLVLAAGEPGAEVSPEVALLRDVLSLAAEQKLVYRRANAPDAEPIDKLAPRLRALQEACEPFIELAKQHKVPVDDEGKGKEKDEELVPAPSVDSVQLHLKLAEAKAFLGDAAKAAEASDRAVAIDHQKSASESLRHFVVDYALIFVKPVGPAPPADPAPTTDFSETEDTMQLFMPGAVTGQRPSDGRSEWQVLGKRDRAALNENFARELPLEFRAILKDYYERLAK